MMTTEKTPPMSLPSNPCTQPTIEMKKSTDPIEPMQSTSSESSIEEQPSMNKLMPLLQDEGYSTWSSIDVKDDIEKNEIDPIGFVKTWLDTTNRQHLEKPVKEGRLQRENVTDVLDQIVFHSMSIPKSH